jgi:hypothetical protein
MNVGSWYKCIVKDSVFIDAHLYVFADGGGGEYNVVWLDRPDNFKARRRIVYGEDLRDSQWEKYIPSQKELHLAIAIVFGKER